LIADIETSFFYMMKRYTTRDFGCL
jgi:hypothetical protein